MSPVQRTPEADTGALPRQLYWTPGALWGPSGAAAAHFCLDGFRFLPSHLIFFSKCGKAGYKVNICFLVWNLQVSPFTFHRRSWVKAFFGGRLQSFLVLRDVGAGSKGAPRPLSDGA